MLLDIIINKESLSVDIENPYQLDIEGIRAQIDAFASDQKADLNGLDIEGLLPNMVRGIAGCESGCPANAQSLVRNGHKNFILEYVEGGILVAEADLGSGGKVMLKIFPEF